MPLAREIENTINHLAVLVRNAGAARSPQPAKQRWWVLLRGESLDNDNLDQRDAARDQLREQALKNGFRLHEYIWVWDSTNTAQLVVGQFNDPDQAWSRARQLQIKGFDAHVVEAMSDT
ncbi:hypothetical protein [Desulfovibrio ferrophilus]|uniref:SPOR domain-containing protein n=1 Tax=Desulfovibrio ferrophilus TaxID=241368 RepID=A0A2Z6AUJ4_9BACT|nr:hypothetical protein [Desulfovibrio ferrophilus]BBD06907.1 putative uncharacterized protein [Desulfovibrio ferrophilus]